MPLTIALQYASAISASRFARKSISSCSIAETWSRIVSMSCLPRSDLHHGERRGLSLGLAEVDRLFELCELGPNVLFQASEAVLLRRIVDRQSLQRIQARLISCDAALYGWR